jgi:hypothetical protein
MCAEECKKSSADIMHCSPQATSGGEGALFNHVSREIHGSVTTIQSPFAVVVVAVDVESGLSVSSVASTLSNMGCRSFLQ